MEEYLKMFVFFKPDFSEPIEEVLESVYYEEELDELIPENKTILYDTVINYLRAYGGSRFEAGRKIGYAAGHANAV